MRLSPLARAKSPSGSGEHHFIMQPHRARSWPRDKELEGSALRVLFPSCPLADEARRHIQITGEDSLTGTLPQTERADFPGFQRPHRRKAQVIEFAHGALVHYAGRVKTFGGLMDRSR